MGTSSVDTEIKGVHQCRAAYSRSLGCCTMNMVPKRLNSHVVPQLASSCRTCSRPSSAAMGRKAALLVNSSEPITWHMRRPIGKPDTP